MLPLRVYLLGTVPSRGVPLGGVPSRGYFQGILPGGMYLPGVYLAYPSPQKGHGTRHIHPPTRQVIGAWDQAYPPTPPEGTWDQVYPTPLWTDRH